MTSGVCDSSDGFLQLLLWSTDLVWVADSLAVVEIQTIPEACVSDRKEGVFFYERGRWLRLRRTYSFWVLTHVICIVPTVYSAWDTAQHIRSTRAQVQWVCLPTSFQFTLLRATASSRAEITCKSPAIIISTTRSENPKSNALTLTDWDATAANLLPVVPWIENCGTWMMNWTWQLVDWARIILICCKNCFEYFEFLQDWYWCFVSVLIYFSRDCIDTDHFLSACRLFYKTVTLTAHFTFSRVHHQIIWRKWIQCVTDIIF